MVNPEKRIVASMNYISRMFTKHDNMLLDPCVGTSATAKACLLLFKN